MHSYRPTITRELNNSTIRHFTSYAQLELLPFIWDSDGFMFDTVRSMMELGQHLFLYKSSQNVVWNHRQWKGGGGLGDLDFLEVHLLPQ